MIILLEGDWAEKLPVSRLICVRPRWVSSHVCRDSLSCTGLPYPSGGILADRVILIHQGEDSCAGLIGRSELAEV